MALPYRSIPETAKCKYLSGDVSARFQRGFSTEFFCNCPTYMEKGSPSIFTSLQYCQLCPCYVAEETPTGLEGVDARLKILEDVDA